MNFTLNVLREVMEKLNAFAQSVVPKTSILLFVGIMERHMQVSVN